MSSPTPDDEHHAGLATLWEKKEIGIAAVAVLAIVCLPRLRFASTPTRPLRTGRSGSPSPSAASRRRPAHQDARCGFGSDLLAGLSIVTSVFLHEYLAGVLVVLMLSGGETLEHYAVARASDALRALASRVPLAAHVRRRACRGRRARRRPYARDHVVIRPHEIAPVDGVVVGGDPLRTSPSSPASLDDVHAGVRRHSEAPSTATPP
ncbi:MAG: hypothetical protein R3B49_02930 [Phycisphaerales bacterium]